MKNLFTYIGLAIAVLSFASCQGVIDPVDNGGNDGADSTLVVPEGVLRIFADKKEIIADGQDEVTFKIMFGSEDVSNAKTLQLTRSYEGGDAKYMAYGANKFSTSTAGKYTFKAEYYYAGRKYSDNQVEVTATPFYTGETENYAQRVLGVYFTSTSCTSCPSAAAGIKKLMGEHPEEISVVAFHKYLALPDPMEIPETEEFRTLLGGFTGLPRLFWNMRKETELIGPDFSASYLTELAAYTPSCGVAISTNYDAATSKLDIEMGVKSNLPAVYRYIIFIIEDNIDKHDQNGEYYVHDNVVRDVLTPAAGEKLNEGLPLTVGVETKVTKSMTLSADWNAASMRVIAAALLTEDGGNTYVVNNVNECKVGESVGYIYNE